MTIHLLATVCYYALVLYLKSFTYFYLKTSTYMMEKNWLIQVAVRLKVSQKCYLTGILWRLVFNVPKCHYQKI